jgi:N-acetylmuramoyl-L-alanine amidase
MPNRFYMALALGLSLGIRPSFAAEPADAPLPLTGKVVLLDPGHAVLNESGWMINPGARARRGAYERNIALAVGTRVVPLLEAQGAKVFMTRTADNPWRYHARKQADNRARAIMANVLQADAYVRLHCDWNRDRRFKGFTAYFFRWGSRELAKHLRKAFVQSLPGHRDNGLHRRSFVSVTADMPAVLIELGVLSYKPEAKELATEAYQSRLAQAVAEGITSYLKTRP